MFRKTLHALIAGLVLGGLSSETADADTILVPADVPTIQEAIDFAWPGDTVQVAPGIYYESLNFNGLSVTVISEAGPDSTIIDAGGLNRVVTFENSEGPDSVLSGFTLQNGLVTDVRDGGGGILIFRASPTITGNTVTNNVACRGAGISIIYGSPIIRDNEIRGNMQDGCAEYQAGGGGIEVGADSGPQIIDNIIADNVLREGVGGGILVAYANTPPSIGAGPILIQNNTISGNVAGLEGGGIHLFEAFDVKIIQNLIVGNSASGGAGLSSWNSRSLVVSNTIANNDDTYDFGPGATVLLHDAETELYNNQIIAPEEDDVISCGIGLSGFTLYASANNVYTPFGQPYAYDCSDQTGLNGNISADPLFVDPANRDYSLQAGSTSLDAGNDLAPDLPATDLAGATRFVDSDIDGTPTIDIGAYEFQAGAEPPPPPTPNEPPVAVAGEDQTVPVNESVTLDGSGSYDPESGPLTYSWSLDGSEISTSPKIESLIFLGPGTYTMVLTVTDTEGATGADSLVVTVLPANEPPTANAGLDQVVPTLEDVRLDGTGSSDPEGGALTYSWSLEGSEIAVGATPTVGPFDAGTYVLTLTVTDPAGATATDSVTITVQNQPPLADAGPDQTVPKLESVTLDATGSSDPEGGALTYSWSLEGSEIATGVTPKVGPFDAGTYVITLTVTDPAGATATDDVTITVLNTPPVANAGPDQTIETENRRKRVTLNGLASFDGDGSIVSYVWTKNGSVVSESATFRTRLRRGVHTLTLTVTDDDGATSSDDVIVTIVEAVETDHDD